VDVRWAEGGSDEGGVTGYISPLIMRKLDVGLDIIAPAIRAGSALSSWRLYILTNVIHGRAIGAIENVKQLRRAYGILNCSVYRGHSAYGRARR
jgi:hypothetical protein